MVKKPSKLLQIIGTSLVGIASLFPSGCQTLSVNPDKPLNPPRLVQKAESELEERSVGKDESKIEGYAETTFASNYVGYGGFVIGEGPANQNLLILSRTNNFVKGDSISVGSWMNYDFGDNELVETDFLAEYSFPVHFMKKFMNYTDEAYGDRVTVGFQHWNYPGQVLGSVENHDNVINAKWNHNSALDVEFNYFHILPDEDVNEGGLLSFKISRNIPLGEKTDSGIGVSMTPYLSYSYAPHDWFGMKGNPSILNLTP